MIIADPVSFIKQLYHADKTLAEKVKKEGCLCCGGKLDTANYPRKVRGIPCEVEDQMNIRFSFCCREAGCRKRNTPKSLRFFGNKVYWLYAIILAVMQVFLEWTQISPKTTSRWRLYFQRMPNSRFWREKRGIFMPPLDEDNLLSSLVESFKCRDGPS